MSRFAVIREGGPRWDSARPLREQEAWDEHAAFMDPLEEEGFVMLGGPLGGGPKTLLIVDASGEDEIRRRLDDDPWAPMGLLTVASVEAWDVLLGDHP
jgi:uncharacterized protein YciI